MKFILLDRITELRPGQRIVAEKGVSLAEEYLAEHFPTFPVLPGVFMLEALVQTSAWLVREALNFEPSVVLLKAARNVTYKSFVSPGQVLTLEAECSALNAEYSEFSARGRVGAREMVKGRLTLRHLRLESLGPGWAETDATLRARQRAVFKLLWRVAPATQAAGVALA